MRWPTFNEWIGLVGAAAWAPQVIAWVREARRKPVLNLVPARQMEVGFSALGPFVKFQLSAFATQRELVLIGLEVTLRHSDGDRHPFGWVTSREVLADFTEPGSRQSMMMHRDRPAIAIRVEANGVVEREFIFQGSAFSSGVRPLNNAFTTHLHFLRQRNTRAGTDAMASRECHDLLEFAERSFLWKAGRYFIDFDAMTWEGVGRIEAPDGLCFDLTSADVAALRGNLAELKNELALHAFEGDDTRKSRPSQWVRRTVAVVDA